MAQKCRDDGRSGRVAPEAVVSRENMVQAYKQVLRNAGAPGIDGMSTGELKLFLNSGVWERIKTDLLTGRYKPKAVRAVEIPKPNGGVRIQRHASMTYSASLR